MVSWNDSSAAFALAEGPALAFALGSESSEPQEQAYQLQVGLDLRVASFQLVHSVAACCAEYSDNGASAIA